jgi:hypothetical protein
MPEHMREKFLEDYEFDLWGEQHGQCLPLCTGCLRTTPWRIGYLPMTCHDLRHYGRLRHGYKRNWGLEEANWVC